MSLFAKHSQGGGIEMQNQSKVVIARCFVFLLALSVVIGSSCTLKQQQQQTTLRIWQTAVDPKAVAVLKDIGAEFERTHPGVRVEKIGRASCRERVVVTQAAGRVYTTRDCCSLGD